MNPLEMIMNAARRLEAIFPGYFPTAKHDHYKDFSYPETLTFELVYQMFMRNGLGRAAVEKTVGKTWETLPALWETENPKETPYEKEVREYFEKIRFWPRIIEADRRAFVGGYAGVILRIADGKRFDQPVTMRAGGLEKLKEIVPAWAGQLTVDEWHTDETDENYGLPKMFSFTESAVQEKGTTLNANPRQFKLHPDRVIVWSKDTTVFAESSIGPGFNALLDMEKVSGAGGEGFWKNAKAAPILEVDKEAKLKEMADAMGVKTSEVYTAMNDQVDEWQRGFHKLLMVQGMKASTLGITLPSPEHFFNIALQTFAASINIPLKILVGNQTGERASSEDARDWAIVNTARRNQQTRPNIMAIVDRLKFFGILAEKPYLLFWEDLTEASLDAKIDRAEKMSRINTSQASIGEPVFLVDEIRATMGMEPLPEGSFADMDEDEKDLTAPPVDPNADPEANPAEDEEDA